MAANEIERRFIETKDLSVVAEGEKPCIRGYASVFNSPSERMMSPTAGEFVEQVAPGAFRQAVKEDDVRALFNHNPNYVLGRNKSGTLALSEDEKGLRCDITPPDTQWARDLMESIRRGDIEHMSFGFGVRGKDGQSWERRSDGTVLRTLKSLRLSDVSVVTRPAYTDTSVAVRSLEEWQEEIREVKVETEGYLTEILRMRLDLEEGVRANPNHDEKGRFSSGDSSGGGKSVADHINDLKGHVEAGAKHVMNVSASAVHTLEKAHELHAALKGLHDAIKPVYDHIKSLVKG